MKQLPIPFRSVPTIYSGVGSLNMLRTLRIDRCFVIASESLSRQSTWESSLHTAIRARHMQVLAKNWTGEPSLADLYAFSHAVEQFEPDAFVAIGGGSVIDAAKVLRLYYEHPEFARSEGLHIAAIPPFSKTTLIAVPTTVGSGSEASSSAIIFDSANKKRFFASPGLMPGVAVHDPALLRNLPCRVRLATLADALTHAVEGYTSILRQPFAESCAVAAVRAIYQLRQVILHDAVTDADMLTLQIAATNAGYAQNHCLVGASHALAHAASSLGFEHGSANAFYLPGAIRVNAADPQVRGSYDELAHAAGLQGVDELLELVLRIRDALGDMRCPPRLEDNVIADAVNDPGGRANPIPLDRAILRAVEEAAQL